MNKEKLISFGLGVILAIAIFKYCEPSKDYDNFLKDKQEKEQQKKIEAMQKKASNDSLKRAELKIYSDKQKKTIDSLIKATLKVKDRYKEISNKLIEQAKDTIPNLSGSAITYVDKRLIGQTVLLADSIIDFQQTTIDSQDTLIKNLTKQNELCDTILTGKENIILMEQEAKHKAIEQKLKAEEQTEKEKKKNRRKNYFICALAGITAALTYIITR